MFIGLFRTIINVIETVTLARLYYFINLFMLLYGISFMKQLIINTRTTLQQFRIINNQTYIIMQKQKSTNGKHKLNNPKKFTIQDFLNSENPQNYLHQNLQRWCFDKGINGKRMSLQQFSEVLRQLPIKFKNKQLHQLYIYAIYDRKTQQNSERKLFSMVNVQANKINLMEAANWIHSKLVSNKIAFVPAKTDRLRRSANTQSCQVKKQRENKLPLIKTRPADRFHYQVLKVLDIFQQMEKQRQNAGLEPVCISSDDQEEHGEPTKQIHYDGDFFEVNQKIFKLRQQAKRGIYSVIQASKHDTKLKKKFQEALMKYQRVRTQANQKLGRCGAMKAQKRMIDRQKRQIRQIDNWRQKTNQSELTTKFY